MSSSSMSLDPDDEGNGRLEGSIISNMLRLHGKHPKYRYVRTKAEFEDAIDEFGRSKYRYLHISAHGDPEGMCTTNLDEVDYDVLADMLTPHFANKRLFLSACSIATERNALEDRGAVRSKHAVLPPEGLREGLCRGHLAPGSNREGQKKAEHRRGTDSV
jgi:hypothetical protein